MFRARCVPNMYLFGTFSAQNASKTAPSPRPSRQLAGTRAGSERLPRLHAPGRAAIAWVEEYGHPVASDATNGAYDAKNGVPLRLAAETIRLGLIWEGKRCPGSAVTGP